VYASVGQPFLMNGHIAGLGQMAEGKDMLSHAQRELIADAVNAAILACKDHATVGWRPQVCHSWFSRHNL
jgi:hypothetical protein